MSRRISTQEGRWLCVPPRRMHSEDAPLRGVRLAVHREEARQAAVRIRPHARSFRRNTMFPFTEQFGTTTRFALARHSGTQGLMSAETQHYIDPSRRPIMYHTLPTTFDEKINSIGNAPRALRPPVLGSVRASDAASNSRLPAVPPRRRSRPATSYVCRRDPN